jgi:NAD+ diphosphatase
VSTWPEADKDFVSGVLAPDHYEQAWFFLFAVNEIMLRFDENGDFQPLLIDDEPLVDKLALKKHFMGMYRDTPCFAVEVARDEEHQFAGLRSIFGKTTNLMLAMAGRAQQICEWYRSHRYCGKCGGRAVQQSNDRAMLCQQCGIYSYPRLSPSIIVLVHRGDEVLLARNHRFPEGMYSTLAGFVEPGESIEETLVREVQEEVGVKVHNLEYLGSQPWPFPNSLMLGFHAEYESGDILIQEDEIADARWFPVNNLPAIPGGIAISRWLIDDYLRRHGVMQS